MIDIRDHGGNFGGGGKFKSGKEYLPSELGFGTAPVEPYYFSYSTGNVSYIDLEDGKFFQVTTGGDATYSIVDADSVYTKTSSRVGPNSGYRMQSLAFNKKTRIIYVLVRYGTSGWYYIYGYNTSGVQLFGSTVSYYTNTNGKMTMFVDENDASETVYFTAADGSGRLEVLKYVYTPSTGAFTQSGNLTTTLTGISTGNLYCAPYGYQHPDTPGVFKIAAARESAAGSSIWTPVLLTVTKSSLAVSGILVDQFGTMKGAAYTTTDGKSLYMLSTTNQSLYKIGTDGTLTWSKSLPEYDLSSSSSAFAYYVRDGFLFCEIKLAASFMHKTLLFNTNDGETIYRNFAFSGTQPQEYLNQTPYNAKFLVVGKANLFRIHPKIMLP